MFDFTGGLAPFTYELIKRERDIEARERRWNRKLRELDAAEREQAASEGRLAAREQSPAGSKI